MFNKEITKKHLKVKLLNICQTVFFCIVKTIWKVGQLLKVLRGLISLVFENIV